MNDSITFYKELNGYYLYCFYGQILFLAKYQPSITCNNLWLA
ncbi:hypothetical protein M917_1476 [Psychrobacter aquaticus CMS 56]|uniref:Uncharacterized protein n=1 Tax=Psychrobacter aquaticus CMS 56 TaxID=1354303 RepID=U4TAJ6_9GAMM|nr:hypothetical protein M917_1476 [Psychrobacter aquaticus CMS 56]